MGSLKAGSPAPDFTLPSGSGESVTLSALRGKTVVLYFYPRDNTPGCTREACSFQEHLSAIRRKGGTVIGVSVDSPDSHARFAQKQGLSFPLLSDEKKKVLRAYGVWKQKSLYGKKFMGIERTTFIIDGKGIITHIFPKVRVDGHTEEILNSL